MRKQVIALVLLFSVNVYAATPSSPITYNGESGIVIDGKRFTSGSNGTIDIMGWQMGLRRRAFSKRGPFGRTS